MEMRKSKKFILAVVLVIVVLLGSTAAVVFAQTGNGDDGPAKTLLARVAEILDIDQQVLEDAFTQAQSEMQTEALENYLQSLVEQDKITQEQADDYLGWWQARPDVPARFGFGGRGGFRGMGGPRGMHSFGWPCAPTE